MRLSVLLAALVLFHIDPQLIHGKHHGKTRVQGFITKVKVKNDNSFLSKEKRQFDWNSTRFLKDIFELYNVTQWTSRLNLQQCVIVEIGEGYCSIFVETRREIGYNSSGLPVDELYLGLIECWKIRNWHLCSPQLTVARPDDCAFTEATSSQEFTARVHRRLCDVTYISRNAQPSNCSQNLADLPLVSVTGFPTCFQPPLPESICYPRSVCGSFKCIPKLNQWCAHSFSCDATCLGGQKFCEDEAFPTSAPQQVISRWSEWGPLHCNSTSGSRYMVSEAQCINQYSREPELDCLGPGLSCCPANTEECKCSVAYVDKNLVATRTYGPCSTKLPKKSPSHKCPATTKHPVTKTCSTCPSCCSTATSCATTTGCTPPPTTECPTATEDIDKINCNNNVKRDGTQNKVNRHIAEELYKRLEEFKSLQLGRRQNAQGSCSSRHLLAYLSNNYDYDDDEYDDDYDYNVADKDESLLKREAMTNNKTSKIDDDDEEDEEEEDQRKSKVSSDDSDGVDDDDDDNDVLTQKPIGSTKKANETINKSTKTTQMSWVDRLSQLKNGDKKKTTPEDEDDEVIQVTTRRTSKCKVPVRKEDDDDDGIEEQEDADDDDDDDDYDDDDGPTEKSSSASSSTYKMKTKTRSTHAFLRDVLFFYSVLYLSTYFVLDHFLSTF